MVHVLWRLVWRLVHDIRFEEQWLGQMWKYHLQGSRNLCCEIVDHILNDGFMVLLRRRSLDPFSDKTKDFSKAEVAAIETRWERGRFIGILQNAVVDFIWERVD